MSDPISTTYPAMEKFPNDPIFKQMARFSQKITSVIVHDKYGVDAGYRDLLGDIICLRQALREQLPRGWFDSKGLLQPDAKPIPVLALSGYYYLISFLTILALGGKCVPLPCEGPLEDTAYSLYKTGATYILSEPNTSKRATDIKDHVAEAGYQLREIEVRHVEAGSGIHLGIEIDEDLIFPTSLPAMVIFTSGTTGKPKGVVHPRLRFYFEGELDPKTHHLSYRPVHWMASALIPLRRVLQGGKITFLRSGSADPVTMWDVLKEGFVTSVSIPPSLSKLMQDYYLNTIRHLPVEDHGRYLAGASKLESVITTAGVLNPSTVQFWRELTNMPITAIYGSTEIGGAALMTPNGTPYTHMCLGEPVPGVKIKLSEGDRGELLVKTPNMFTHYLDDEEATRAVFDEAGFYKTGDIFRRIGSQYYFEGRESQDWVNFTAFKISTIELEQRLLELPYVSEACVLSILDYEAGELPAAVIRIESRIDSEINLRKIRDDLSPTTEAYKLPVLLRILRTGEELPRTLSGKAMKNRIRQKFFQLSGYRPRDYAVPGVEVWDLRIDMNFIQNAGKMAATISG